MELQLSTYGQDTEGWGQGQGPEREPYKVHRAFDQHKAEAAKGWRGAAVLKEPQQGTLGDPASRVGDHGLCPETLQDFKGNGVSS